MVDNPAHVSLGARRVEHAEPDGVAAGQVTSGIDTTLLTPGAISGRVRGESGGRPGGPVGGICVLAEPVRSGRSAVVTVTARNGTYSAGGLLPGGYRVQFEPGCGAAGYRARWYPGVPGEQRATVVDVRAARNRTGINVSLPHG